jgi:hypothetical protein
MFQKFIVVRRRLSVASVMLRHTARDQFSETVEFERCVEPPPPPPSPSNVINRATDDE